MPTNEEIRARYIKMAKTIGFDQSITALHAEIGKSEPRVFDGGYDKEKFERVEYLRALARDLYTMQLDDASLHYYKKS